MTITLAHYLDLLTVAGMVTGLQKYAGQRVRRRASSPKLQVLNTALSSALHRVPFAKVRRDPERWGRLIESAVGAHLVNGVQELGGELSYWRERDREVDFVVKVGDALVAIEVKSGRRRSALRGMEAFGKNYSTARRLLVGGNGIEVETFLSTPVSSLLGG